MKRSAFSGSSDEAKGRRPARQRAAGRHGRRYPGGIRRSNERHATRLWSGETVLLLLLLLLLAGRWASWAPVSVGASGAAGSSHSSSLCTRSRVVEHSWIFLLSSRAWSGHELPVPAPDAD